MMAWKPARSPRRPASESRLSRRGVRLEAVADRNRRAVEQLVAREDRKRVVEGCRVWRRWTRRDDVERVAEHVADGENRTTSAGEARRASRPPFTSDRCFRTAFISLIVQPARSMSRARCCFSSRVTGAAGATSSAEPPPEMRQMTRSPTDAESAISSTARVPATPASSGTGCPASIWWIVLVPVAVPRLTVTTPSDRRLPRKSPPRRSPSRPSPCRSRPQRYGGTPEGRTPGRRSTACRHLA